MHTAIEREREK